MGLIQKKQKMIPTPKKETEKKKIEYLRIIKKEKKEIVQLLLKE